MLQRSSPVAEMPLATMLMKMINADPCAVFAHLVDRAAEEGGQWTRDAAAHGRIVPATVYDSSEIVPLATETYLRRWVRYLGASTPEVFVVASVYLNRVCERKHMCVTGHNKFRLVLCCIMAADKFLNDDCRLNTQYAAVGGVSLRELRRLERTFLMDINFELFITSEVFVQYVEAFEDAAPLQWWSETVSPPEEQLEALKPRARATMAGKK